MFAIGEFSKITQLTVKTLRFYHEEGLLVPSFIDPQTGYRYYHENQIETARSIAHLRGLEFPLDQIRTILTMKREDEQLLEALAAHQAALQQKITRFKDIVRSLDQFIAEERKARTMTLSTADVQEKVLEPMLIAGIRMKGKYQECGQGFGQIGRKMGRHLAGTPFLLHYDSEYKENDADFEACIPVKKAVTAEGITVRELPGGKCVALLHKGPYDQMGPSYARILKYVQEKGYQVTLPTREVYLKGPGMIFKGNPQNYLTEIQFPIS